MTLFELINNFAGEGVGIFLITTIVLQISPIKVNPWSYLAKKIGRAINGEIMCGMDKLTRDVKDLKDIGDEREADASRRRILRFNDEILHGLEHSKEHFDQILVDIKRYEDYCVTHPFYRNNMAVHAIHLINGTYRKCCSEGTFL